MTTDRRRDDDYAAAHAVMTWQREERRQAGRPLRAGDFIQAHIGGPIRQVVQVEDAGSYIERKALEHPRLLRGSAAESCAMYGGRTKE
jgi:hypothetical protein